MNWISIRAVIKARRNGLLRLVPATKPTRVDCLADRCAKCCRTLGAPVISPEEADRIGHQWILKNKCGMFVKLTDHVCCLLKNGLCLLYSDRPKGCREYPWYNIDGQLYYDSGCPGIKHDKDEHPDISDIQPFENFFPRTPGLILWLVKKICVKKISKAKSLTAEKELK